MSTVSRAAVSAGIERVSVVALLLLPIFLTHGRGIAECLMSGIAALFLIRSALVHEWGWFRTGWLKIGLLWWGWLVLCSLPIGSLGQGGLSSLLQAVLTVRVLIFVAALEHLLLRGEQARLWLRRLLEITFFYMAAQTAFQFVTGHNMFGWPRGPDGELTGPYQHPRAAPPYSRLLFPVLLPMLMQALRAPWQKAGVLRIVLAAGSVGLLVLMGERMPLLLVLGPGLGVAFIYLRRLRLPLAALAVLAGCLVAASPVISPQVHHRLVEKFSQQMGAFGGSHYGQILSRSLMMTGDNPLTGRGFDGFRTGCDDPHYFGVRSVGRALGDRSTDGGGAEICVQHPHNHYLQALTDAGYPGLLLFSALVIAWVVALARGLYRHPTPLRVGLLAAVVIQEWPLASASSVTSMPLSGWFFLLLGFGLAEARLALGSDKERVISAS
ncbi:O-antigen ligase family protein [Granulibacter bethesdensis]|uniref:O-antigen ligase family protein n=1 Tax=Granulibacter bethesdensis TaxID=364410 RepID=UPI00090CB54F|nr:O-antigen ligase family protein [Granulibacter bethesdensis]APH58461.1 Hypothetical protein GbCGDNIH7_0169 [Granulibacter bethesdensis]